MANLGGLDDAVILLQESRRMYGNLRLIGNFGKGGQARATWRLSTAFKEQGYIQKATETHNEARTELEALGPPLRTTLSEKDFNCLLNFADA
ncbi:hypothetical protein N7455_006451 [Penicillium solitum]|uniref:uncharacterized protein n=1 Tax=Penicillium solitum TaxID=60172 RepID=UPI0017F84B88|nr:hypothetical protein HAV15_011947 [Penicillium sp. str. \